MNANEMTFNECCRILFEPNGWECGPGGEWWNPRTGSCATLDDIAAAMPEGYRVDYIRDRGQIERPWFAGAIRISDGERHSEEADTELLARARLAVVVRRKMQVTTPSELHGPATCPCECSGCDGEHHWIEGVPDEDEPHEAATVYGLECWYSCKHCDAWATCEYVWALEDEAMEGEQ